MSKLDRRTFALTFAAGLFLPAVSAAKPRPTPPKVLFVCQYGTVKSAIARELLKRRSSERRIPLIVASRGITPEEHISADLLTQLTAEGIDRGAEPLRKLEQKDLDDADIVILFDRLPPSLRAPEALDWRDVPSMLARYPEARADVDRRIDELLLQLSR